MQIPVKFNYLEIRQPLPGNPLATIGNSLAPIGKLPNIEFSTSRTGTDP